CTEKQWECEQCNQKFAFAYHWEEHTKAHQKVNNKQMNIFKCRYKDCKDAALFNTAEELKTHQISVHIPHGYKVLECSHCDAVFYQKSQLSDHERRTHKK